MAVLFIWRAEGVGAGGVDGGLGEAEGGQVGDKETSSFCSSGILLQLKHPNTTCSTVRAS